MSRYTKTRPGGYYNHLLMGDQDDFMKLLKRYAISPPNNISATPIAAGAASLGRIKTGDNDAVPTTNAVLLGSNNKDGIEMQTMPGASKVGYVELFKQTRQVTGAGMEGDSLHFRTSVAAAANHDQVYYLPWQDNVAVRLTIDALPVGTAAGPNDPSIFFTAAINGCSVFFKGTPAAPVIYHCGGSSGYGNNVANAVSFWENIIQEFTTEETTAGSAEGALALQTSVNKGQYVTTAGVTANFKIAGGVAGTFTNNPGLTTQKAKTYLGQLKRKHALGKVSIEAVSPWGCILGRRDPATHNWVFYLQENATITYHQISMNPINRIRGVMSNSYAVARPMSIRQIFPNGPAHVTLKAGLPSIKW